MKKLSAILFILVISLNCSDEENPSLNETKNSMKLKSIIKESETRKESTLYFYDDLERVSATESVYESKDTGSKKIYLYEFEYYGDDSYSRFYYLNSELIRTKNYKKLGDSEILEETIFASWPDRNNKFITKEYSSCGGTKSESFDSDNELTGYDSTNFIDSNCSFERLFYDANGTYTGKTISQKDGKKRFVSPYFLEFYNIPASKQHNTIRYKSYDSDANLRFSYDATYDYNEQGYPIFSEIRYDDGRIDTFRYEYSTE